MDEKSFLEVPLKGHRYISVMVDIDERRVLDVAVDRKKETVDALWSCLSKEQRDYVEAVSLDF